ncbi:hypothetical protein [Peptostreptococcus sp. D1]|uniref:hypothetical protein n=1 Tax=Peptostreptococcus sp. D1 TaxID=72304 RepID=UPI0008E402B5|nr:hypothetical protein [Peptostreptococcus sp. D1]SFE71873.1 hypothetical protein SAMN02910278_01526 [Peptostreptococcus sp. D1]
MKKRIVLQKLIAFFLVFIMLLGVIVPNSIVIADSDPVEATITEKLGKEDFNANNISEE